MYAFLFIIPACIEEREERWMEEFEQEADRVEKGKPSY